MLDDPLGGDLRHVLVGLMHPLFAAIAQGESDCLGKVVRVASGFSWGGDLDGKHAYCAGPDDIKGRDIMNAFAGFLRDHPQMTAEPYGAAMAATLSRAFRCAAQ